MRIPKTALVLVCMGAFLAVGVADAWAGYADEVLLDAPVGYWRFNDPGVASPAANSGTSGAVLNGTYVGSGTSLTAGMPGMGTAVTFDNSAATNDYVNVADHPDLDFSSAMTLEALVKTSDTSVAWARIIDKRSNNGYTLNMTDRTGRTSSYTNLGNAQGSTMVADGQWHHVAATYDGGALSFYVDGRLQGVTPAGGNITINGDPLAIGINRSTGVNNEDFLGSIDEVAVYGQAIGADRIAAHAAAAGLASPGLIFNGSFEEPIIGSGLVDVNPGITMGGWKQGTAGVKGHYLGTGWQAADGNQSYHLGAGHGAGSVSQTFPTVAGQQYELTFWSSGFYTGDDPQWGTVAVGDLDTVYWTPRGASTGDMGWVEQTFLFTALSDTSTLTFGTPAGPQGTLGIDGVSVVPVGGDGDIPEPATVALLGLAIAGLGGYVRRRR